MKILLFVLIGTMLTGLLVSDLDWSQRVVRNQEIAMVMHGIEIVFLIFMAIGLVRGLRVAQETKGFIKGTLKHLEEREKKDGRSH